MNETRVDHVVAETFNELPGPVRSALADVIFVTAKSPRDRIVKRVREALGLPEVEGGIPDDARGMFLGVAAEAPDVNDDEAESPASPPMGAVFMFASNLCDEDDVATVLCHEVGHALGLGEDDVEALGLV